VDAANLLSVCEIGDGTRDPKDAMESTRGQAHRCGGIGEELAPRLVGCRNISSNSPSASAFVRGP